MLLPVEKRVHAQYTDVIRQMPEAGMDLLPSNQEGRGTRFRVINDRCAFPDCPNPRGNGRLCDSHWRQWTRNRELRPLGRGRRMKP